MKKKSPHAEKASCSRQPRKEERSSCAKQEKAGWQLAEGEQPGRREADRHLCCGLVSERRHAVRLAWRENSGMASASCVCVACLCRHGCKRLADREEALKTQAAAAEASFVADSHASEKALQERKAVAWQASWRQLAASEKHGLAAKEGWP